MIWDNVHDSGSNGMPDSLSNNNINEDTDINVQISRISEYLLRDNEVITNFRRMLFMFNTKLH